MGFVSMVSRLASPTLFIAGRRTISENGIKRLLVMTTRSRAHTTSCTIQARVQYPLRITFSVSNFRSFLYNRHNDELLYQYSILPGYLEVDYQANTGPIHDRCSGMSKSFSCSTASKSASSSFLVIHCLLMGSSDMDPNHITTLLALA